MESRIPPLNSASFIESSPCLLQGGQWCFQGHLLQGRKKKKKRKQQRRPIFTETSSGYMGYSAQHILLKVNDFAAAKLFFCMLNEAIKLCKTEPFCTCHPSTQTVPC